MTEPQSYCDVPVTDHARARMAQRGVRPHQVGAVLSFGRRTYTRGAEVYVIGRREVEAAQRHGVDLRGLDGLHVVCTANDVVLTVFRNKQLQLRDSKYRRHARAA